MRVGDVVSIPASAYGTCGLIVKIYPFRKSKAVQVHTGSGLLDYEIEQVSLLARIKVNQRRYGTPSGNRINVCRIILANGKEWDVHVNVRGKDDLGEETRALEIRKRVFEKEK